MIKDNCLFPSVDHSICKYGPVSLYVHIFLKLTCYILLLMLCSSTKTAVSLLPH